MTDTQPAVALPLTPAVLRGNLDLLAFTPGFDSYAVTAEADDSLDATVEVSGRTVNVSLRGTRLTVWTNSDDFDAVLLPDLLRCANQVNVETTRGASVAIREFLGQCYASGRWSVDFPVGATVAQVDHALTHGSLESCVIVDAFETALAATRA